MKIISKRLLSTLLAVVMMFGLFTAMPPAASAVNTEVTITQSDTVGTIEMRILKAVSDSNSGDTITVTGAKNNADRFFTLLTKSGVTVIWKADYSGTVDAPNHMLYVSGDSSGAGAFEVAAGGSIVNNGTGCTLSHSGKDFTTRINGTVKNTGGGTAISYRVLGNTTFEVGGTVSANGSEVTILVDENCTNTTLTVSGGKVENTGSGHAIYSRGGNITVSGGTVESKNVSAIRSEGPAAIIIVSGAGYVRAQRDVIRIAGVDATVIVSGGTVSSTGDGTSSAIYISATSNNTVVNVSGGTVSARGEVLSHAICSDGASSAITVSGGTVHAWGEYGTIQMRGANPIVNVSGGFVFGFGKAIIGEKNVIYMASGAPTITNGVVCAFDPPASLLMFAAGTSTNLTSSPAGAATWGNSGSQGGIKYANGANTGFFPISGVNVIETVQTPFPFTDVPATAWYYDDVKTAWEQKLVDGKTTTLYAPDDNLTYAQAVKLAACMHQLYMIGTVTLTNGSPNWYDSYVSYAKAVGIISTDYVWGAQATRAGYMAIFANALPDGAFFAKNTIPNGSIPDVPMTHPQAAAIYKLYRAGIVQGFGAAHNCNPDSYIRRSEVAAILTRMMNETARISFSL